MNEKIHTQPYKPNPNACCEACVFGTGEHENWCPEKRAALQADGWFGGCVPGKAQ